ncbi:sigma 54-interacting transcriptional regulator [Bacillus sp. DTU_2020_1000418_1_SI_GHA_SEK_038]|uniref:sigma-54 interaction domain-containing protein n=1 Tax=Bacillus sp. DTU_2020_1000418_1_SI_GHA_SEK_038 TaxID=3077585 RepID=UPI0028EC55E0|nr:sigma 54-interacting transcriptional regulator [Bacillus sp. DTU_2020_1000418_1_SI_GHA_SEK_038]WNS76671.1 sigma 54-interacting transcriptional regulator [Bacillus sp. DTU_2020_1000418_1_SI_GHA_SEK_038]
MGKNVHEIHYYKKICDELYDGIYITDGEGKTIYVNKAYSRITGLAPELVLNKYVSELMKAGLFKNAITPDILKTKKPINAMAEIRTGVKVLISGSPILNNEGNVEKVVVINRDMSDLLEMQDKLNASQNEIEHLRNLQISKSFIGTSEEIQPVIQMIHQVANLDVTVLITGETGVGKEVVGNEIYSNSNRKGKPFIKVNCAAIPASLLEAELFGYEAGAFTGASSRGKVGMFELADKGTLLLDEIGEMPLELQSKLLRIIQEKEVTRVGGTKSIKFDVRIIASTNCDLSLLVKQGKFREDLFYRLNVFPIHIPSLRDRIGDIEVLTKHFLYHYNTKYGKKVSLDDEVYDVFQTYKWPGNIRELQNVIERMVIISEKYKSIDVGLAKKILNIEFEGTSNTEISLKEILEKVERQTIQSALKKYGSTRKIAAALKISQSSVVKKAKKLGIPLGE